VDAPQGERPSPNTIDLRGPKGVGTRGGTVAGRALAEQVSQK
jgi:hypothetical protein